MLNVKNLSTISFGQLNFHKNGDRLIFDDFTCKNRNNEGCFVKSEKDILDNFKETVKIYPSNILQLTVFPFISINLCAFVNIDNILLLLVLY